MNSRFSAFLISLSCLAGCLQKVDDGLAAGGAKPGPEVEPPPCDPARGFACNFQINETTPVIGLKADQEGEVTDGVDPTLACAKVSLDVAEILQRKCASCHEGAANAQRSPLTFIMDSKQLTTTPSSAKFGGKPYVMPGSRAGSLIYQRAVIDKDMPFQASSLAPPNFLTISEASVLDHWIMSCVDGAPPQGATTGGGATGAGGTSAGGTSAGGTSAGGTSAGGTSAGGGGLGTGAMSGTGGAGGRPLGGTGGEDESGDDDGSAAAGGVTAGAAAGGAAACGGGPAQFFWPFWGRYSGYLR